MNRGLGWGREDGVIMGKPWVIVRFRFGGYGAVNTSFGVWCLSRLGRTRLRFGKGVR